MPVQGNNGHEVEVTFTPVTTTRARVLMKDVPGGAHNPDIIELTWK